MDSRAQAIQRINQVYDEITRLYEQVASLENEIQKMRNTIQPPTCPECKQLLSAQDGYYFCVTPGCGNAPEQCLSDSAA